MADLVQSTNARRRRQSRYARRSGRAFIKTPPSTAETRSRLAQRQRKLETARGGDYGGPRVPTQVPSQPSPHASREFEDAANVNPRVTTHKAAPVKPVVGGRLLAVIALLAI